MSERFICEEDGCSQPAHSFCTNCGFRTCSNYHGEMERDEDACPKCPKDEWNDGWWVKTAEFRRLIDENS